MIHLGKVLDRIVNKIFLSLTVFAVKVDFIEIVLDVFLALLIDVRSIDETKGLDHNRQTAIKALVSDLSELPGESVKDFNSGFTVLSIAKRDENILLEFGEDSDPF